MTVDGLQATVQTFVELVVSGTRLHRLRFEERTMTDHLEHQAHRSVERDELQTLVGTQPHKRLRRSSRNILLPPNQRSG